MRNFVKRFREKKGLTQQQLAVEVGCSIAFVQYLEQHPDKGAGVEISAALARVLDVDQDQLFVRWERPSADRIGELGELYGNELTDVTEEDRQKIFVYVLSMDASAWKVLSRGRLPWADLWKNACAFDEYVKKFTPAKK